MNTAVRDELVALTTDLMRFRSTADQPQELAAAMDYVARYLQVIPGLFVQRSEENGKPSLVATLRDTRSPALMLNGHLDVVSAEPEQFEPRIEHNRIYGRGSQDMKGSIAVLLRLLRELTGWETPPDVGVQFVSDEEIGGAHGTGRLVREGWRCNFFIAAEPTDLHICHQQKGGVWLQVRQMGMPGHASRPWDAHNPLYAFSAGLAALVERFPPPAAESWQTTVVPTLMHAGGVSANQIPAEVTLSVDIRRVPEDTPEALIGAVQACFPEAEVIPRSIIPPLVTNANDAHIRALAEVTTRMCGHTVQVYREHYSSDARFYSEAGIPAVCFGPVGHGLHSDDEWIDIDSLAEFYRVLCAFSEQFL